MMNGNESEQKPGESCQKDEWMTRRLIYYVGDSAGEPMTASPDGILNISNTRLFHFTQ